MVPAKATIPVHVIVNGDAEGNRSNLSIKNDIRLVLSAYARYEEPDPELTGYIDPSLFGTPSPEQPDTVTVNKGGQK